VTPVPGSERWPLGYRIVAERFFRTVEEFRAGVEDIIDAHMPSYLQPDQAVRFRRDLLYEAGEGRFNLRSRNIEHRILDDVAAVSIGELIASGKLTASELISHAVANGAGVLTVADLLDQLYGAGVLEEDLDDRFVSHRNEGLEMRAASVTRAAAPGGH